MDPCRPKAPFQLTVGARQVFDIIALKQTRGEVGGNVTKMRDGLPKGFQVGSLFL